MNNKDTNQANSDRKSTSESKKIQWRTNMTYLGVELDRALTWKFYVENVLTKINFARIQNHQGKSDFFSTITQFHLRSAWRYATKTYLKRLRAAENV